MMSEERLSGLDPRMQAALDELRGMIEQRYPTATFAVSRGHDEPENIHLTVTVDLDDPDEVLDLLLDRLLELQVEDRVPVYVIPIRTPERVLADVQPELGQRPPRPGRLSSISALRASL